MTNYKVMFSTLNNYEDYELIRLSEVFVYLFNPIFKVFFLKRSPYSRLESFYKDKIVKNPKIVTNTNEWQYCQKIILEAFNQHGFANQKRFFETLSYEDFILNLKKYYLLDGHLRPQYMAALKWKFYYGNFLQQIDITTKEGGEIIMTNILNNEVFNNNPTSLIVFEYTKEMNTLIGELYSEDFRLLGYEGYRNRVK